MNDAMERKQHIPDILDCLAQLSNDEVPTPPKLAHAMLDALPGEVWSNPHYKWLDPSCKSGAILREVAARLLVGLEPWQPDFAKRREHIFRNMLFGTSVTELTGLTVEDFQLLNQLGLFNAQNMNAAIYQFKAFEDASLHYADEHRPGPREMRLGLWDRSVLARVAEEPA